MKSQILPFLTAAIILIFANPNFAQTPDWAWARSGGSISNDYSNATCTDAFGHVYITGTFQGSTTTFGDYPLQNSNTGTLDIFIAKYDMDGNFMWAKSAGGTNNDYAYGICCDKKGNVYVTGYFLSPTITFESIILNNSDSTEISPDIFIAKYDSLGNALWIRSAANKCGDYSYSICADTYDDLYITGTFGCDMVFGSDTLNSQGSLDIFIAKYDADGNILWARETGGDFGNDVARGICTDASGNIYVTGYSEFMSVGTETFIAKYDASGNQLWINFAVGTFLANASGIGIAASADGSVYITGYYGWNIIFNDTLANVGNIGVFLAKYDANGNVQWGRTPGGTGNDFGTSVCTDASGDVFISGFFSSSFLNFGGIPLLNANTGYNDIYVAEYDSSGNVISATAVGGQDYEYAMGICNNKDGDIYVTGYFGSYSLDFGSSTIINNGSFDVFLAKLSSLVGIDEGFLNSNYSTIFPNPTSSSITLHLTSSQPTTLSIFNLFGEKMKEEKVSGSDVMIDVSELPSGLYFVRMNETAIGKFVKQ